MRRLPERVKGTHLIHIWPKKLIGAGPQTPSVRNRNQRDKQTTRNENRRQQESCEIASQNMRHTSDNRLNTSSDPKRHQRQGYSMYYKQYCSTFLCLKIVNCCESSWTIQELGISTVRSHAAPHRAYLGLQEIHSSLRHGSGAAMTQLAT